MTKAELTKLIKPLELKEGCKYAIFISMDSGLSMEDLARINLSDLGVHSDTMFILVDGDVNTIVRAEEVK